MQLVETNTQHPKQQTSPVHITLSQCHAPSILTNYVSTWSTSEFHLPVSLLAFQVCALQEIQPPPPYAALVVIPALRFCMETTADTGNLGRNEKWLVEIRSYEFREKIPYTYTYDKK